MGSLIKKYLYIIIFLFTFEINVNADNTSTPEVEKFKATKKQLMKGEDKKRDLMSRIYFLNKEVQTLENKRARFEKKVLSAENHSRQMAYKLVEQKSVIEKHRIYLRKKLKLIYMYKDMRGFAFLDNLLRSGTIDKNLKYLKLYSQKDANEIKNYNQALVKLSKQSLVLKTQLKKLVKEKKQLAAGERRLEKIQKQKISYLKSVKKKIGNSRLKLVKIRSSLPVNILSTSFFEKKGNLPWPVQGALYSEYGLKLNKEFQYRIWKKSVTIQAIKKQKVYAIHPGKVVFAGFLDSFGGTVIIDHEDHYYTIYSQLTKLLVDVGEIVEMNEEISDVGFIKTEGIDGIEFSIRHYSQAKDPLKWINKKIVAHRE